MVADVIIEITAFGESGAEGVDLLSRHSRIDIAAARGEFDQQVASLGIVNETADYG